MALTQHLWTRSCDQRFFFFFWAKFRQNAQNIIVKGIFCRRFLEILKNKIKMAIKVEVLSWFCQI